MNDIEVKVTQQAGVIDCNIEEIKEALERQMTAYMELEITEGNIKESKADLATLRKIKKAVDDRRKEVKRTFNKPYEEFEAKVKDVLSVIDKPIDMIDAKLKGFEEKRIAEKIEHTKVVYAENIGGFEEFLPYSAVFKSTWKNATCTDNEIISDIQEAVVRVKNDLAAIKGLNSEIEEELIGIYKNTGNLAAAIAKNSTYIAVKKQLEERRKAEEEAKARAEAAAKARAEEEAERAKREAEEAAKAAEAEPEEAQEEEEPTPEAEPESFTIDTSDIPFTSQNITFTVATEDAESVRQFLEFNEIEYTEE